MTTRITQVSSLNTRAARWGTRQAARLLLGLLLFTLPAAVRAQSDYTIEDGQITGYSGPGGVVNIPSTINGVPVTGIGERAFAGNTSLFTVTIPDGVTTIGFWAFNGCAGLNSINIPKSVTNIDDSAFGSCAGLQAIEVAALNPDYRSVDGVLFNKDLTKILRCPGGKAEYFTIPNSVVAIGYEAFAGCAGLTSVTIPSSVATIGDMAFVGCSGLTSVTIPNSVADLGNFGFLGCAGLTNVTLPSSVTSIGLGYFAGCTGLTSITLPDSLTDIGVSAFSDCTSLTSVEIPYGVATINIGTFTGCSGLTSVSIPQSVTLIDDRAFAGCTSLTRMTIPNSVTAISLKAFKDCSELIGVYFQGNAPDVGEDVFAAANGVTVYFLAGTVGWGATFASRPTAVWSRPLILSNHQGFGAGPGGFGFTISWAPNASVVVETVPDLGASVWIPVSTNFLTTGTSQFTDPQWTSYPTRLYRVTAE